MLKLLFLIFNKILMKKVIFVFFYSIFWWINIDIFLYFIEEETDINIWEEGLITKSNLVIELDEETKNEVISCGTINKIIEFITSDAKGSKYKFFMKFDEIIYFMILKKIWHQEHLY